MQTQVKLTSATIMPCLLATHFTLQQLITSEAISLQLLSDLGLHEELRGTATAV